MVLTLSYLSHLVGTNFFVGLTSAVYTAYIGVRPHNSAAHSVPTIVSSADNKVELAWNESSFSGFPIVYNVLVSIHDLATFTESDFSVVAHNLTTTSYTYENLFSNSTYTFAIQPLNFLGFGARSISSKTVQIFDVPAAPASVSLSDFIRLNGNNISHCFLIQF